MEVVYDKNDGMFFRDGGNEIVQRLRKAHAGRLPVSLDGRGDWGKALSHLGNCACQLGQRVRRRRRCSRFVQKAQHEARHGRIRDLPLQLIALNPARRGALENRCRRDPLEYRGFANSRVAPHQHVAGLAPLHPLPGLVKTAVLVRAPDERSATPLFRDHRRYWRHRRPVGSLPPATPESRG